MVEVDCYGAKVLRSYGTAVIRREPDGTLIPLWEGWSATTGRHIKAFCGLNKAEYQALRPIGYDEYDQYATSQVVAATHENRQAVASFFYD